MLKQRLNTEPELQQLMTQYVSLELKVQDPDFRRWTAKYRPTGNGIPMIFIVASDGTQLYNQSGAPGGDGLKRLLMQGIEQTGGFKSLDGGEKDKQLAGDVRRARLLLGQNSTEAALKLLSKYVKQDESAQRTASGFLTSSTSPAAAATATDSNKVKTKAEEALDELLAEVSQTGAGEIKRSVEFATQGKPLIAAVALARAERLYDKWLPLASQLEEARQKFQEVPESEKLLAQAEHIDKARSLEEKKMTRLAIAAYKEVVERFPDTEAAKLSQKRVIQLAPSRTWTDKTGQHKVQAVLVQLNETHVQLRKKGGELITLARDVLSERDQEHLRTIQQ